MALEKFTGFGFKNRTSDEFEVYSVTTDATYSRSVFSDFEDKEESVVGQEGSYYFGTDMRTKPLNLILYLNNVDRETYFDLQTWLNPNSGLGNFFFFEEPYKYYRNVKVVDSIDYGLMPYEDVYTAQMPVTFKSYDPYSYSYVNTKEEGDALGYELGWSDGTGILPLNYTLRTDYPGIITATEVKIYNGGNARTKPIITISGTGNSIGFTNLENADTFLISGMASQTFIIDCVKGQITEGGLNVVGRSSGGFINLEPTERPKLYSMVFTNGSTSVTSTDSLPTSIVGREIVVHDGTSQFNATVVSRPDANTITLEYAYNRTSGTYNSYALDVNKIVIGGTDLNIDVSFEFPYAYL